MSSSLGLLHDFCGLGARPYRYLILRSGNVALIRTDKKRSKVFGVAKTFWLQGWHWPSPKGLLVAIRPDRCLRSHGGAAGPSPDARTLPGAGSQRQARMMRRPTLLIVPVLGAPSEALLFSLNERN